MFFFIDGTGINKQLNALNDMKQDVQTSYIEYIFTPTEPHNSAHPRIPDTKLPPMTLYFWKFTVIYH